jgi:hypothetical protein
VKKAGSDVQVTVMIQNIGDVSGAEIPQLYVEYPSEAGQPSKVQ